MRMMRSQPFGLKEKGVEVEESRGVHCWPSL